jgi:hypothetical protein
MEIIAGTKGVKTKIQINLLYQINKKPADCVCQEIWQGQYLVLRCKLIILKNIPFCYPQNVLDITHCLI